MDKSSPDVNQLDRPLVADCSKWVSPSTTVTLESPQAKLKIQFLWLNLESLCHSPQEPFFGLGLHFCKRPENSAVVISLAFCLFFSCSHVTFGEEKSCVFFCLGVEHQAAPSL